MYVIEITVLQSPLFSVILSILAVLTVVQIIKWLLSYIPAIGT